MASWSSLTFLMSGKRLLRASLAVMDMPGNLLEQYQIAYHSRKAARSAQQEAGGELEVVAHVVGGRAAGYPGDEVRQPDIADDAGDGLVVGGRLAVVHGLGEHVLHQPGDRVDLGRGAGIGEHEGPGHRFGEHRLTLHGPGDPPQHVQHPLLWRLARERPAVEPLLGLLELPG